MKPYYEDGQVTIYHGDSREIMPTLPDASVAAVLTDPPYSDHTHNSARTNKRTKTGNGSAQRALSGGQTTFGSISLENLTVAFTECGRITKGWVVSTLDTQHSAHFTIGHEVPGLRLLRTGVWVKTNPMPSISGDRPGQGWEAIAYFHRNDTKPKWNGGGRAGNWVLPTVQKAGHPTSKPVEMVGDWVRLFTNPGDTVFDPFAGSGTTLRAAVDNGRKAIGVEIDEAYCELIAKRLSQGTLDLFGGAA
jgi:site-specific DNA-methyltransferase (adenine-specific)